jgi:hypothetical protein
MIMYRRFYYFKNLRFSFRAQCCISPVRKDSSAALVTLPDTLKFVPITRPWWQFQFLTASYSSHTQNWQPRGPAHSPQPSPSHLRPPGLCPNAVYPSARTGAMPPRYRSSAQTRETHSDACQSWVAGQEAYTQPHRQDYSSHRRPARRDHAPEVGGWRRFAELQRHWWQSNGTFRSI